MLLEGATVAESAFECGFESMAAFYSNFKKETGCSPKSYYRNNVQPDNKPSHIGWKEK